MKASAHILVATCLLLALAPARAAAADEPTIFGKHVQRDGLHFQVAFG